MTRREFFLFINTTNVLTAATEAMECGVTLAQVQLWVRQYRSL